MKEATVIVKLSKDNQVTKFHVTPIEAMLLTAEHHRAVGDVPVVLVNEKEVTETTMLVEEEVDNPHKPGTKRRDLVRKPAKRTVDDELDRLRSIYGRKKVDVLSSQVRDLPTEDFKVAIDKGMKLSLPSSELSQTKLI